MRVPRAMTSHEDANPERESQSEQQDDTHPHRPADSPLPSIPPALAFPRHRYMLSGAETPRSARPFRVTWPTAAQSASRARVSGRSSVMIRWAL